jgi:hypothetical protein
MQNNQNNANHGNPSSRRPQQAGTGFNQNNRPRQNTAEKKIEALNQNSNAALSSVGISDRVGPPIPTPSDALIIDRHNESKNNINDDIPQWKDPDMEDSDENYDQGESEYQEDEQEYNSKPAQTRPTLSKLHPVLCKLRQEFGIESVKTVDVEVGSIKWTLKALTQDKVAYAIRITEKLSDSPYENMVRLSLMKVASSVVAIDGVPLYKVFNVKSQSNEKITDPFNPPVSIQRVCTLRLYDLLSAESLPTLGKQLADAYDEKIDPLSDVSIDNKFKSTYICTKCGQEKKLLDRVTEGGEKLPYFCELDGAVMEPAMTSEEASNSPLA